MLDLFEAGELLDLLEAGELLDLLEAGESGSSPDMSTLNEKDGGSSVLVVVCPKFNFFLHGVTSGCLERAGGSATGFMGELVSGDWEDTSDDDDGLTVSNYNHFK